MRGSELSLLIPQASTDLILCFSRHPHPLGSPAQRGRWPFMLPVEQEVDGGGDKLPLTCAQCLDVGCSEFALVCAVGCPRIGICGCCAEARPPSCPSFLACCL